MYFCFRLHLGRFIKLSSTRLSSNIWRAIQNTVLWGMTEKMPSFAHFRRRCKNSSQINYFGSSNPAIVPPVEIVQSGFQCFRCSQGLLLLQNPALTQTGSDKPPTLPKPPLLGWPWKRQWWSRRYLVEINPDCQTHLVACTQTRRCFCTFSLIILS